MSKPLVIQVKREILVHVNTLSNTVHEWTNQPNQHSQLKTTLLNLEKRFERLSDITDDKHEANMARDRTYRLSELRKNLPSSISKDNLEQQVYFAFDKVSVLYMPLAKVNSQLHLGLTDEELRAA